MITQLGILNLAKCEASNRLKNAEELFKVSPGIITAEGVAKSQALFDELERLVRQEEQKDPREIILKEHSGSIKTVILQIVEEERATYDAKASEYSEIDDTKGELRALDMGLALGILRKRINEEIK